MRRFSGATRYAYQRLLEGKNWEELKRENGPLCQLFGLNTRYAGAAIEKAQATLDSAKELGQDPRKVVFGGRKFFEQLKRKHLSGKALLALKREWKERRQGSLCSRGDATKKGNANLRLESRDGALWLRVNLGNGGHVYTSVKTAHPQREALLQRAYASLPYNVTLRLEDGKVYAHFTWSEEAPPPVHTEANGVLGVDVNGDPYHLALAVASPDGNLVRYLTLSLEEVDRAPNKGPRNSSSGRSPTRWWPWPRNTGSPSPWKSSSTSGNPGGEMAPADTSAESSTASPIVPCWRRSIPSPKSGAWKW
jgi:predicted transposase